MDHNGFEFLPCDSGFQRVPYGRVDGPSCRKASKRQLYQPAGFLVQRTSLTAGFTKLGKPFPYAACFFSKDDTEPGSASCIATPSPYAPRT
jgi:hypothetical protein